VSAAVTIARRAVAPVALVVGLTLLAACGGGDAAPMSADTAHELETHVTAVRAAVDARDADAAGRALDDLRAAVDRLRGADRLSDSRAAGILTAVADVDRQLVTITTTTTTTTTTAPPPPTAAPDDHGNGKDNGNGKGKGKGGD